MGRLELLVPLALGLVGLAAAGTSLQLPFGSLQRPGAGPLPFLWGLLLAALAGVVVAHELRAGVRPGPRGEGLSGPVLGVLGVSVAMVLLWERAGFFITAAAGLFAFFALIERRPVRVSLALAISLSLSATAVFAWGLKLPLPPVPWGR